MEHANLDIIFSPTCLYYVDRWLVVFSGHCGIFKLWCWSDLFLQQYYLLQF